MALLQKLLKGLKGDKEGFKERLKEAQMQDKVMRTLEERQKSSNRRELERDFREEEEAEIKRQLEIRRKRRNQEQWKSNTMLGKQKSILKDDRPILKEKNIFMNNKNTSKLKKQERMFKW